MTSNTKEAYVWIWLQHQDDPIVCGRLKWSNAQLRFNYGQSYLSRKDAIPIYGPELPLKTGEQALLPRMDMPGCIRDGSPDAWGRRVIINQVTGKKKENIDLVELDELAYLLKSGSDRIGNLDFQESASTYVARSPKAATLEELQQASELVDKGIPLTAELDQALNHGSSIGGARPKASVDSDDKKYIAKFFARNRWRYSLFSLDNNALDIAFKHSINCW